MKKIYTFDKYSEEKRDKNYIPMGHLTIEDEIRESYKGQMRVVKEIIPFNGFAIVYCEVKTEKEYEQLQKAVDSFGK